MEKLLCKTLLSIIKKVKQSKNLLKNLEKSLKKYFRYLFRYLPVKLWGAVGSYQVHSRAKKCYKMLGEAPKNPKLKAVRQW